MANIIQLDSTPFLLKLVPRVVIAVEPYIRWFNIYNVSIPSITHLENILIWKYREKSILEREKLLHKFIKQIPPTSSSSFTMSTEE